MSTSSDTTSPRDFWSAIARFGATGAPRLTWEAQAGPEFALLAPFLTPTNGPLCRSVPCPVCSGPRRVSMLPDDVLLLEIGDHCAGCGDEVAVSRKDVTPTALHIPAFANAAGAALRFQAEAVACPAPIVPLGTLLRNATMMPVGLVLQPRPARDAMELALSRFPPPAVLLFATPAPSLIAELRARRYTTFSASALLQPKPKGAFRAGNNLALLVAESEGGAQFRPVQAPLSLRGRRYEIAEGFVAITKLGRKPVRHEITQPRARALLRALVESGAGSEATGIEKAALLRIVYGGNMVPDVRPAQLLRSTGAEGTRPLPFRDDILRHNKSGGIYWLEL